MGESSVTSRSERLTVTVSFFKIVTTTTQGWMVLNTSWVKVLWSSHIHYHSTVTKDRQDDRAFSMYGCSFLFLHLLLPCVSVGIAATEWHTWIRSTHHPLATSIWSLHHFGTTSLHPRQWLYCSHEFLHTGSLNPACLQTWSPCLRHPPDSTSLYK